MTFVLFCSRHEIIIYQIQQKPKKYQEQETLRIVHQQKLLIPTDGKKSKTIKSEELRVQSGSLHIISEATMKRRKMKVSTSIINTSEMRDREADEEPKDNITSTEERTEEQD